MTEQFRHQSEESTGATAPQLNPVSCTGGRPSPLRDLIDRGQRRLAVGDEALASALGFESIRPLTAIKKGLAKLPARHVPQLARALRERPATVLDAYLSEYMPELGAVIREITEVKLTGPERRLVDAYRHLSKGGETEPLVLDGTNIIALVVT